MGPERKIENEIIKRLRMAGIQVEWLTNRCRRGWPDLTVFLGERVAFLEVKRPGGSASENQLREMRTHRLCGRKFFIVNNVEEAYRLVSEWCDEKN